MKEHTRIHSLSARQILDSRGNPTVETTAVLKDGSIGIASVPSGASTGKYEACELRDGVADRYLGRGVEKAVGHVNEKLAPTLLGISALEQTRIDELMITLDGAYNKSNLGANAILSVSVAVAKAAAASLGLPLYRYLGGAFQSRIPVPMMNILNGGAHAKNNIDMQEFMIVPVGFEGLADAVRACAEVYHSLKALLTGEGLSVGVGDEGGFAPDLPGDEVAIEKLLQAIEQAGYIPGKHMYIALDVAASEWWREGVYHMPKRGVEKTTDQLIAYFAGLVEKYPILSIEDALGEEDFDGWTRLTERLGERVLLVGDDLFVTNPKRLQRGVDAGAGNAILIKPNQIGTLSETAAAVTLAKRHGYRVILSHRSGETADTAIADIAMGLGADFLKSGAPARAERTEKYNRLLKMDSEIFGASFGPG